MGIECGEYNEVQRAWSNGKLGGQWRCEKHGAHGFSADGSGCAMCESERQTKPARRFCACGQETHPRYPKWCGDCAATFERRGTLPGHAPSLDTRIAAACAVTDETEGAWMVPHGEGP